MRLLTSLYGIVITQCLLQCHNFLIICCLWVPAVTYVLSNLCSSPTAYPYFCLSL